MQKILYRSTNRKSPFIGFKEALLKGQAPDYGLYMPTHIPKLAKKEIESLKHKRYFETAFIVLRKFLQDEIDDNSLRKIAKESYNFEAPLEAVKDNLSIMRLDRGPTASFKDFAARPMARLMLNFARMEEKDLTVLVSTSGDTGGAVADAFDGLKGVNLAILFPEKGVSKIQRKQMTTKSRNIRAMAVKGSFDDCQALAKQAFNDKGLQKLNLTSANSINIGRLLPQIVYYFYAYAKLNKSAMVFSVPSGNFGNLMGGVLAREMGLPVEKFVAAVNENCEFPDFLKKGIYKPVEPARNCSSNAMNVGHPSNLARLVDLYGGWLYDNRDMKGKITKKGILKKKPNMQKLRKDFASYSITDKETDKTIEEFNFEYKKLLEPHGAVAWCALQKYIKRNKFDSAVSLETADPAKFPEKIKKLLGIAPKIPKSIAKVVKRQEFFEVIENDYKDFKQKLME